MTGDVRWWMLVLSLAVLVGACSSAEEAEEVAAATVPTAEPTPDPAPEATEDVEAEPAADDVAAEEPEDPYAVPDEIDEDYVQRILDVFASIEGDALREIAASGMYTPEADELYASIYAEEALQEQREIWSLVLESGEVDEVLRDEPSPRMWTLVNLDQSSSDCFVGRVRLDFEPSNILDEADARFEDLFIWAVAGNGSDVQDGSISWKIRGEGSLPTGQSEVPDLCR